jgi:hypothetical protein
VSSSGQKIASEIRRRVTVTATLLLRDQWNQLDGSIRTCVTASFAKMQKHRVMLKELIASLHGEVVALLHEVVVTIEWYDGSPLNDCE